MLRTRLALVVLSFVLAVVGTGATFLGTGDDTRAAAA